MFKIKSGELKPQSGFVASRSAGQEERVSTEPLAALGIEFNSTGVSNSNTNFVNPNKNKFIKSNNFTDKKVYQQKQIFNKDSVNKKPFFNKDKKVFPDNNKHSSPSPLLKGLLEKIAKGESNEDSKGKNDFKIEEKIKPIQKPISLSELKKVENPHNKPINTQIVREASEEKKSSLKDVLSKFSLQNHKVEEPKKENEKVEIPIKIEEKRVEEPKKEEKVYENKVSSQENLFERSSDEGGRGARPFQKDIPVTQLKPELKSDDNSWQKRKAKKEVPEDVLRKVLE